MSTKKILQVVNWKWVVRFVRRWLPPVWFLNFEDLSVIG